MAFSLLLLLAFLIHAAGSQEPVFREAERSLTGQKGRDITLYCVVNNLGDRTVIWRRLRDTYPISVGHTYFSPTRKYITTHDQSTGVWALTIRQVQREDVGEYECRLTGTGNYVRILELNLPGSHTHFTDTPQEVLVRLGETATLPCTVRNRLRHLILWRNNQGDVLTVRKKNYSGDRRFRLQQSGDDWHLRIKKVQESDLGSYTCIVNSNPVLSRSVILRHDGPLPEPPQFDNSGFQKTRDVREGEPLSITCRFTGFPAPRITWSRKVRRNGRSVKEDLQETSATLTFSAVKVEDAGTYTCTARNGNPPSARGRVRLSVEPLPTTPPPRTTPPVPTGLTAPRIYAVEERVGGQMGWHADLQCVAVGSPLPHVSWKRHGQVLRDSFQHRVTSEARDEFTSVTSIRVRSLLDHHFGPYECHAANAYGTHMAVVELFDANQG